MSEEKVACLFCQVKTERKLNNCSHCGMALAKQHPEGKARHLFFSKVFWAIVVFSIFMIYYLPR